MTGVLIGDTDDLIDIHIVAAADFCQFVGVGDIDIPVGVFDDLGHFRGADVGDDDLALAEGGVGSLDGFAYSGIVGADGTGVMLQFIDHVAGDDAFRGMDQIQVLTDGETGLFHHGADKAVNGAGGKQRMVTVTKISKRTRIFLIIFLLIK